MNENHRFICRDAEMAARLSGAPVSISPNIASFALQDESAYRGEPLTAEHVMLFSGDVVFFMPPKHFDKVSYFAVFWLSNTEVN